MGLAASMGQFLLSAGQRGKRYALPHCQILMHQPSAGVGGTESDIAIQAELFRRHKQEMAQLISGHTGQPVEKIIADFDRDRWFSAQEALEYGFVDHVISRAGQLPGRDQRERERERPMSYQHPPQSPVRAAVLRGAHELRGQGVQPVQQAVRGAHHLPRRADRRRVGQRRHGAAAVPGVGRPGPRDQHVHQLARRLVHVADGDLRHDAVHPARHPDRLPRAGRVGRRGAAGGGHPRPSARGAERAHPHPPARGGGDLRAGVGPGDPGRGDLPHAQAAGDARWPSTPAAPPSRCGSTSSATRSSPPKRPRSTASSTRSSRVASSRPSRYSAIRRHR